MAFENHRIHCRDHCRGRVSVIRKRELKLAPIQKMSQISFPEKGDEKMGNIYLFYPRRSSVLSQRLRRRNATQRLDGAAVSNIVNVQYGIL